MTDLQTLDAPHALLDTHPDDWATRQVLADLFADLGQDAAAACQRWMAANGRRPVFSYNNAGWLWQHRESYRADVPSNLPEEVWAGLAARPVPDEPTRRRYDTRLEAEADLLAALRAAGRV